MVTEVIFDVETKKLFSDITTDDPGDLGVSVVSAYMRELDGSYNPVSGQMRSFWEKDFPELFAIFEKADRIIGFNSVKFDVPALQPYTTLQLAKLPHFDILDKVYKSIGRRIGLNALAGDTLGSHKTDVGTNAVLYWAKGDAESIRKLQMYCEADVAITRDLYDYGFSNRQLKYTDKWNNQGIITVDFSYPVAQSRLDPQISLF